jgi:predicted nuclease of predicted toxin-antitoxin system
VANENCAVLVIRARREAAHDFAAITEIPKGIPDEAAMERAFSEGRLLITEDADFGELVYAPDGRRRAAS